MTEEADLTGFDPHMTILECFMLVGKIALPPVLGNLIQYLVMMITIFFVGRKGDTNVLAAVGLGNMMINVLAFAIMQGLNGALEHYVSLAYGNKSYIECGQWLNRGKLVGTLVFLPTLVIFINSDWLMVTLGQDPVISKMACTYVTICLPGAWS